jgi:hypothetical protein
MELGSELDAILSCTIEEIIAVAKHGFLGELYLRV